MIPMGAGGAVLRVIRMPRLETNMRGPIILPMLIRSHIARSIPSSELRFRIVVTPASSAFCAFSCARNAVTAGCREGSYRGVVFPVPVIRDVGVRVDQAGNTGVSGKIDHFRAARYRDITTSDASHAVVVDSDHGVCQHPSCPID